MMIWIKYRHKFANGPDNWEAMPINVDASSSDDRKEAFIDDFIQELREQYSWSEHYRGIEWEYWIPTDEVLDRYEQKVKGDIAHLESELSTLKEYRSSLKR